MGTDHTELEEFRSFVDEEVANGGSCTTIDQAVAKFRELQRLRAKLRASQAQSERKEAKPLDIEEVIAQGTQRAAEKGITD